MKRQDLLPPLSDEQWPSELTDSLTGSILNIHRMVAHNPTLTAAYAPLRNYIVKDSSLTERQRELLILRAGHIMKSEYEWTHHVVRGRAAGLTDAEITRVQEGPSAEGWTDDEQAILRSVDEMRAHQELTVETAASLQQHVGNDGVIDTIFTIGIYLTLGTILKTFEVPLDESIKPLE